MVKSRGKGNANDLSVINRAALVEEQVNTRNNAIFYVIGPRLGITIWCFCGEYNKKLLHILKAGVAYCHLLTQRALRDCGYESDRFMGK